MASPLFGFDESSARKIIAKVREIVSAVVKAEMGQRRTTQGPGLLRARLTEDLDDDNPEAEAKLWRWDDALEDWVETDIVVRLRCFLRPEGETIANRTRVLFRQIGRVKEIVVMACAPDPEEE